MTKRPNEKTSASNGSFWTTANGAPAFRKDAGAKDRRA